MSVCGIDSGSMKSLNHITWIENNLIYFDTYVPTAEHPLPLPPRGLSLVTHTALDCPQGLPARDNRTRIADRQAHTPTQRLPQTREELNNWKLYGGLVRCGIDIFWSVYANRLGLIPGLNQGGPELTVFETYPRYVLKRLWPTIRIPSKRYNPMEYINTFWPRILDFGFSCTSVFRPSMDQLDSVICAVVANKMSRQGGGLEGTVGTAPSIDLDNRLLREGFIVSP